MSGLVGFLLVRCERLSQATGVSILKGLVEALDAQRVGCVSRTSDTEASTESRRGPQAGGTQNRDAPALLHQGSELLRVE